MVAVKDPREFETAENRFHTTKTLGYRDACGRLASLLLALAKRNERQGRDASDFVLSVRRAEIGDVLGFPIETVNWTFRKLKADGVIDLDQGGYVQTCDLAPLTPFARGGAGHAQPT
jgi:CRP-like cAMP-binding protein